MRIAVLTNAYPPDVPGGASRIAAAQVEMLKAAGQEVRVWPVKVAWFGEPPWKRLVRHFQDLAPRPELVREITAWKPQVLITHNMTGCGYGTPKAIQKTGVRWFHVLHDVQLFDPSGKLRFAAISTPWQAFWGTLRRFSFGRPDVVISPTRWLLRLHMKRRFFRGTRNEVLPNPGPAVSNFPRHRHDPLRMLFMGHLTQEKGSRVIMRLMRELEVPVEWHIVSDGPLRQVLEAAGPTAKFYGYLDMPGVRERMLEADILLVPSQIEENQPTVILEAAAVGLPVIASDKRGIRETLDGSGILCAPHDIRAWKEAIERLAQPNVHQAASARMFVLADRYDPKRYGERLLSLVKSNR